MRNWKKIIFYVLIGILILIQLYPVNRPEVTIDNSNDLLKNVDVPKNISSMLKTACYDCHSNETVYPWYASISPVKWWVYDHINEGREELNFSNWISLSKTDKAEMLDDIATNVMEENMPLKFYPLMHSQAKLSEDDRQAISDWTEIYMEELFE